MSHSLKLPFQTSKHTADFARYSEVVLQEYLRNHPEFHNCLAPGCESGQIHFGNGGGFSNLMTCNACGALTCVYHAIRWHNGMTCEQYDEHIRLDGQRKEENAASAALILATAKICPNPECHIPIEKTIGCDHFTCALLFPSLSGVRTMKLTDTYRRQVPT